MCIRDRISITLIKQRHSNIELVITELKEATMITEEVPPGMDKVNLLNTSQVHTFECRYMHSFTPVSSDVSTDH